MIYTLIITSSLTPLQKLPASASTGLAWTNRTVIGSPEMVTVIYAELAARRQQPIPTVPFPLKVVLGYTSVSMTWLNRDTLDNPAQWVYRPLPRQIPGAFFPLDNMPVTVSPSRYAIEIRDKNFRLKDRLENAVTNLQWEWNKVGGCGRATMTVDGNYLRVTVAADDDIRIYLPNATTGATLWYRGYVESVTPAIESGDNGNIKIECMGYFGWMERITVQNSNAPKVYSNQEVSLTVQDIIDSFVVANSSITRGTINGSSFAPDTLSFKVSAREALRTCADLIGPIEYGVDATLAFFWYNRSETLAEKFYLGGNVTKIADRVDFKQIINQIYFEGGNVAGAAYVTSGAAADSKSRYGLHEEIVSNGAISTSAVATRYISSLLTQKAKPARQLSVSLKNITRRFEASLPVGAIAIVDPAVAQARFLWGRTANGGANKLWGTLANSGSQVLYGGTRKEQVDRVVYTLSPEDGRIHADVQFGDSIAVSKASATLKQIEQIQDTLRQRSL